LGRIVDLGVREGHIILIWGYAEWYNFDLGVRGYQKVENPCSKSFMTEQIIPQLDFQFCESRKDIFVTFFYFDEITEFNLP
jgi:hypothetical protein